MNCIGTYDGTIFYNPANKFCIFKGAGSSQQRIFKVGLLLAQTVFNSCPFC